MTIPIHMDFSEASDVLERVLRAHADIADTLQHLDDSLDALQSAWNGQASQAYDQAQHQWRQSQVTMIKALYAATRLLRGSIEIMQQTERTVAEQWPQ